MTDKTKSASFAFAKYYSAEETIRSMKEDDDAMYRWICEEVREARIPESVLWRWAMNYELTQKHFTEYMDGKKTHKQTIHKKVRNEDGSKTDVSEDAHITDEGIYYQKWDDGDEPKFYMKEFLITPEYFKIWRGTFVLNDAVRGRMRKGTLNAYLKKIGEVLTPEV